LQQLPMMVVTNDAAPAKACMLSKTLLELQAQNHPLAEDASLHLSGMERQFADLFARAQALGEITATDDPGTLARRYQSDLLGLRVSAERSGVDAKALATEIAEGVARL